MRVSRLICVTDRIYLSFQSLTIGLNLPDMTISRSSVAMCEVLFLGKMEPEKKKKPKGKEEGEAEAPASPSVLDEAPDFNTARAADLFLGPLSPVLPLPDGWPKAPPAATLPRRIVFDDVIHDTRNFCNLSVPCT